MAWVLAVGPMSFWFTILVIAAWHLARVATARKSGGETASDSRQGNVEQSHIRSSRTGTGSVNR